ncbi:hypothetical protein RRG08_033279 [Elysia crispata]|uniref:Uncharacterized protein n=1 Tax=Elysia crispata TaxID=231223 RepID=A0AAE0XRD5_9GAST|nr:hypothetical protein RRG08_033279 [Elysia crispata]
MVGLSRLDLDVANLQSQQSMWRRTALGARSTLVAITGQDTEPSSCGQDKGLESANPRTPSKVRGGSRGKRQA